MNTVKIIHNADSKYTLLLNDKSVKDCLSTDLQAELLELANVEFDKQFSEVVKPIKDDPDSVFLWCITYEDFRQDTLYGTVCLFYILQLINHLCFNEDIDYLIVDTYVPEPFIKTLKKLKLFKIKRTFNYYSSRSFNIIKKYTGPIIPILYFLVTNSLKAKKKNSFQSKDPFILIQKGNRYRGLIEALPQKHILLFNRWITSNRTDNEIDFYHYSKLSDLYNAISNSVKLKRNYKIFFSSPNRSNLFVNLALDQSVIQFAAMRWRYIVFDRFLLTHKSSLLIVTQTLNDRISRLNATAAFRHHVKVICNTCRPMLTSLRTEDRLFSAEYEKFNHTIIADYFIVLDLFSINTLVRMGIDKNKIIPLDQQKATKQKKLSIEDGFLIIFEANSSINESIIKNLFELKDCLNESKIYYRTHPNTPLTNTQIVQLQTLFGDNLINITSYKWDMLEFKNVVALNVSSTAGIEAVKCGAGIVWLPYLSEISIVFYDVMKIIGMVIQSSDELTKFIKKLHKENFRNDFISSCQQSYVTNFKFSDSLSISEVADKIMSFINQ